MSTTGEPGVGEARPEALEELLRPAATRDEVIASYHRSAQVYGSIPEWLDEAWDRARGAAAFDRSHDPEGQGRQLVAVAADGSRADELRHVRVPFLVMHGARDTVIDPSGGRRTAELVPDATYVEIDELGHDYPPASWDVLVGHWIDFVRRTTGP